MAELTNLESKLGEVLGLAMAAQGATEKVKGLPDLEEELARQLERMREEARQTEERATELASSFEGKKTAILDEARDVKQKATEMMQDYLDRASDALDGFEFLTMAEAGEAGHWEILQTLSERAGNVATVDRQRERDVAVADEHERRRRQLERRLRRLLAQNVLPHRVARARVEQLRARRLAVRREAAQECLRLVRQDAVRPQCRGCGLFVEVAHRQLAERDEIVIADEADARAAAHDVTALVRLRSVPDGVAEAPHRVDLLGVDRG